METLPDDLKHYAEIVHPTLNEGPNAILSATNSLVVADVYKRIIGYLDTSTGTFISSKSTLINSGDDTTTTGGKKNKPHSQKVPECC